MNTESSCVPENFAHLNVYASEWALPSEKARKDKRRNSTLKNIETFYNAMSLEIEEIADYLSHKEYSSNGLSENAKTLYLMALMYMECAMAVEILKSPEPEGLFSADRFEIHGGNI